MRPHVLLLYALLVSNVLLRLFTNKIAILPKVFNIADVFLTVALFLLSLAYTTERSDEDRPFSFWGRLLGFNVVLVLGAALNLKFFHPPAALSQIIMWNEPLLLFAAVTRLPFTADEIEGFKVWLVRLIVIELAIGVVQVPFYLATGDTETIIGTFYGNAEQYQGFIMLGIYYLLARQALEPDIARRLWGYIAAVLLLIALIDNKASWLGVLVSILAVMHFQERRSALWFLRPQHILLLTVTFGLAVFAIVELSPSLKKFQGLANAVSSGNFRNLGKVKAYDDILHAFGDNWQMGFVGSGPGNFYSRSGMQFYLVGASLSKQDVGPSVAWTSRTSNSMGGVISLTTHQPFYAHFFLTRQIYQIGSGQVDMPFSSYAALLGETGIIGTVLYLSIYFGVLRRILERMRWSAAHRPQVYPMAVATFGLFIYMMTDSGYNSWLETGRMTTIAWGMAALLLKPVPERSRRRSRKRRRYVKAELVQDGALATRVAC